jgi:hypothetical protein
MGKDPAFLFYSSDFISGTLTMSYEQLGRYIRMLCLQHQKGTLSERDMKFLAEGDEELISKFIKTADGYYNERLRNETIKRNAYSESRRKNKMPKDMSVISTTYDGHMENVIVNENVIRINELIQSKFDITLCEMWNQWKEFKHSQFNFKYKTYQTEVTAINNLYKLSNGKTNIAVDIINQSIANGWKGFFEIRNSSNQSANEKRFEKRVEYSNRYDK